MPDRDVVLAKAAAIQQCLRRIRNVTGLEPDRLNDLDVQGDSSLSMEFQRGKMP